MSSKNMYLILFVLFFAPLIVFASNNDNASIISAGLGSSSFDPREMASLVIKYSLGFLLGINLLIFLLGWFLFLSKNDLLKKNKST